MAQPTPNKLILVKSVTSSPDHPDISPEYYYLSCENPVCLRLSDLRSALETHLHMLSGVQTGPAINS